MAVSFVISVAKLHTQSCLWQGSGSIALACVRYRAHVCRRSIAVVDAYQVRSRALL